MKAHVAVDPKLSVDQLGQIQLVFEQVLTILPEDQAHRKGGYFRYYHRKSGMGPEANSIDDHYTLVDEFELGQVLADELLTFRELSEEKAHRLAKNTKHQASWSSRDPAQNQWGGAIRSKHGRQILSFSGLPERYDEALVLVVGIVIRGYDFFDAANMIGYRTGNRAYFQLLAACLDILPKDGR